MIFTSSTPSERRPLHQSGISKLSALTLTQLDILKTEVQKSEFLTKPQVNKKAWVTLAILLTIQISN
jgi:hypothetical protein